MANEYLEIAKQAARYGHVQNVMHLVNEKSLYSQHKRQVANKATGVDQMTKIQYGENVSENLRNLVARMRTFSYKPLPVKRVYIPKVGSDKLRPLGIPAYEDKLVQGAMAEVLNAVYETKFLDCSYGFRPNRSCHDAIKALNRQIMTGKVNWIVDADIKGFFDNVNHEWLIKFLEHDIKDKNFIRYVKRFLISGIMDKEQFIDSDKGTPQGGLISPVLANVYLHYVLDLWFEKAVKPQMKGEVRLIRYADDFVCCFQIEQEARNFFEMLKERLAKFGLEIAEDKSKIIRFGRFAKDNGSNDTFDFLGFTHINSKTRDGRYKLHYCTSKAKMKAKKQAVSEWLRANMHERKEELVKKLNIKLAGHYRYYGITNNFKSLIKFLLYVSRRLYDTLKRRSQRFLGWKRYNKFLEYNPLAQPKLYVSLRW
jgi:group II intron reverse transcriptase/maturase